MNYAKVKKYTLLLHTRIHSMQKVLPVRAFVFYIYLFCTQYIYRQEATAYNAAIKEIEGMEGGVSTEIDT
jgi:hypothetical protein